MKGGKKQRRVDGEAFDSMADATLPRPIEDIRNIPPSAAAFHFSPSAAGTLARSLQNQTQLIQGLLDLDPDSLDDVFPPKSGDRIICSVRSNVLKSKADLQFAGKNYADARSKYVQAASEMVAAPLPFDSRIYAALGPRDGWDAVDLMACINGAIECSRQLLDYESVRISIPSPFIR
jgi:hypothetical protein